MFQFRGACAHGIQWPGSNVLHLLSFLVEARDESVVRPRVYDVRIPRIGHYITSLASAHVVPVRAVDRKVVAAARDGHGRIVLLRAVHPVRNRSVSRHMIKLRCRLIVFRRPAFPGVVRNTGAAVVRHDHPLRTRRVDPQSVVVAVWRADELEALATVRRARHSRVQHVYGVGIFWICKNVMKIPGTLCKSVIGIDKLPALARILASINAALFCFNDRVNSIGIPAGNGNPDAPQTHSAARALPAVPRCPVAGS